jgi:phosphatidylserine/phosphatidylglycerophosphate/cardiolipin synthase-like enzyme
MRGMGGPRKCARGGRIMSGDDDALLRTIFMKLGGEKGRYHKLTYQLNAHSDIVTLLSTPNLWGRNPRDLDHVAPAATNLTQAIGELAARTSHILDIATLDPFPDGDFVEKLKHGIRAAAETRHFVVRVLIGTYNFSPGAHEHKFDEFLKALDPPADIPVYLAAIASKPWSWNHGKIVMIDNREVIAGGHNQYSDDYCRYAPVHDCSIHIEGPIADAARRFLNLQWQAVAYYSRGTAISPHRYYSRLQINNRSYRNALPTVLAGQTYGIANTSMLALAKLGSGLVEEDNASTAASRTARLLAVRSAQKDIKLCQQMVVATPLIDNDWKTITDWEFVNALAERVSAGVNVSMIISDTGATNAKAKADYGGAGVKGTACEMFKAVRKASGKSGPELISLLKERVHIAPVRFYHRKPTDPEFNWWKWRTPDGKDIEPGNHAKVYVIDDQYFYVGSDNAYLNRRFDAVGLHEGLQEFGVLIGGKSETADFLDGYWNKFWSYASSYQFDQWHTCTNDTAEETSLA